MDSSKNVVPPERDRRRTERVQFEALYVRLAGTRQGILVDLSEGGALVQLSVAPPRDKQFTLEIDWKDRTVQLQARVVRSVPRQVQTESATLARTEYYVALEFVELRAENAAAIRQIIQNS